MRWLTGWIGDAGSHAPARGPAAPAVPTEEIFAGLGATEQVVLGLLSGSEEAQPRVVTWEGMRYRLDLPRAEAIRLSKALGEAPHSYLSSAESFADVADAVAETGLTRDKLVSWPRPFAHSNRASRWKAETMRRRRFRSAIAKP